MQQKIANYTKVEAETNDPIKLIIMLFEGAINFTEQAKLRMMENKMADKGILISKVLAIVGELQSSLNLDDGGEVATNMDRVYHYITQRLVEANSENNEEALTEVIGYFRTFKEAWTKARQQNSEQVVDAAPDQIQGRREVVHAGGYSKPDVSTRSLNKPSGSQPDSMPAIEVVG
jgi:flagellar protein FliS